MGERFHLWWWESGNRVHERGAVGRKSSAAYMAGWCDRASSGASAVAMPEGGRAGVLGVSAVVRHSTVYARTNQCIHAPEGLGVRRVTIALRAFSIPEAQPV
jgi:hypothetical protein